MGSRADLAHFGRYMYTYNTNVGEVVEKVRHSHSLIYKIVGKT